MPGNVNNPGEATPPPLNEAEMLEWIEGRLSRIEESNRAAKTRPGVSDRVRQMQANRRALQTLGTERAPAELMDRVLAAMEREALVGISNGEAVSDHLPINITPHIQEQKKRRRGSDRLVPALALAAGVALLIAGTMYLGSVVFKSKPSSQLASNGANSTTPTVVAQNTGADKDLAPKAATTAAGAERPEDVRLAKASEPSPLSTARVLELARQGRLVMRVQAKDLKGLAQIDAMENSKVERSWHLSREVPQTVLVAVMPRTPAPLLNPFVEPTYASAVGPEKAAPPLLPNLPPLLPLQFQPRTPAAYLVDFPNTEQSLAQIKKVFETRLHAGVTFEELPEALDIPRTEDPETLLWWTLPPAQWVEHVRVPVVVQ
jgi:hypothetical protein